MPLIHCSDRYMFKLAENQFRQFPMELDSASRHAKRGQVREQGQWKGTSLGSPKFRYRFKLLLLSSYAGHGIICDNLKPFIAKGLLLVYVGIRKCTTNIHGYGDINYILTSNCAELTLAIKNNWKPYLVVLWRQTSWIMRWLC